MQSTSLSSRARRLVAWALGFVCVMSGLALPIRSGSRAVSPVFAAQGERCFRCPPQTTPGFGTQLFSTGQQVKVTILPADAAFTSDIYFIPPSGPDMGVPQFIGTNRDVGRMTCLDSFPAPEELIFEIRTGNNVFRTGPGDRNSDGLVHARIDCQLDRPIINFEDLPGLGSDRDFNDVRIEVSCCDDKCDLFAFRTPQFFLNNLNHLPGGAVLIGGVNFNNPVSTRDTAALRLALGGSLFGGAGTPLQQLNREFLAFQLSLELAGGSGSPAAFNALWSPLRCPGLFGPFGPVRLGNGFVLDSNAMLKDLFTQTRLAILANRTADFAVLASFFADLSCDDPGFPSPGGGICFPRRFQADLVPVQTAVGFCRRDAAGNLIVTVRNIGTGFAGASTTKVEFFLPGGVIVPIFVPTPSIPAGGSVEVSVSIPAGCFSADCSFRIMVNSGGSVSEARYVNNTVSGNCIG